MSGAPADDAGPTNYDSLRGFYAISFRNVYFAPSQILRAERFNSHIIFDNSFGRIGQLCGSKWPKWTAIATILSLCCSCCDVVL
jgi:hypothetical protein